MPVGVRWTRWAVHRSCGERMNRRTLVASVAAVTLLTAAGAVTAVTGLLDEGTETVTNAVARTAVDALDKVAVRRGDLSTEREFRAEVSFGDQWVITTAATGTITQQRAVGETVEFGETLLRIDDKPVFLANGTMPTYRELHRVDARARDANGDRLQLVVGLDVTQLQSFLLDAGFDADGNLEIDGQFGGNTEKAVKAWQEAVGLPVTGSVDDTQIVFAPDPVRIATESRIGAEFEGLEVNNAESAVLVDTTNRDRAALPVGADVALALPDGTQLAGTVTNQAQVTAADGSQVWRTTIQAAARLPGAASSVTVTVTELVAKDVLLVPTGALLALAEGGFAVEVITGPTTDLVRTEVGEVLDGQAEISGDLAVGDEVVVAT